MGCVVVLEKGHRHFKHLQKSDKFSNFSSSQNIFVLSQSESIRLDVGETGNVGVNLSALTALL